MARKNPPYGYDTPITFECLEYMKYDALAIGDKEISWGLDELQQELTAHHLVAVSANIIDTETGKPRFEPYRIVKVGRLKVGVTSVIGGGAVVPRTLKEREGIEVDDPIEAAQAMLKELEEKKVDVKVIIAHAGLDKAQEWAPDLAGYDVVLVGYGGRKLDEPSKENGVILAATGARSNWLGELTLTVENDAVRTFTGRSFELALDDGPFDPYVKELTWTKLELDESGNRVRQKKADDAEPAVTTPPKEKEIGSAYLGGDKCALCHADVAEFWATTPHARAFETVAQSEEWEKPECWNCHTVGYGKPTGHPKASLEPTLWNVQCESCHGMGSEHARGAARTEVTEATCRGCHDAKWSPQFDYAKALKQVSCAAAAGTKKI